MLAGRWKGFLVGFLVGLAVAYFITKTVVEQFRWVAWPVFVCALIIGLVMGKTSDSSKE